MLHTQSDITAPPIPTENVVRFLQSASAENNSTLKLRLRRALAARAHCGTPMTYKRLAGVLLSAGGEISTLDYILQQLMEEDARDGRPLLAALAVGAPGSGLPAPWFFRRAEILGKFVGSPVNVEAFAFHARELHRSITHYRSTGDGSISQQVGMSRGREPDGKENENA